MHGVPVIGITMGDPAGIGPEVIVKALAGENLHIFCRPLVIGDFYALEIALKHAGKRMILREVHEGELPRPNPGTIDVISVSRLTSESCAPGMPCPEGGKAMVSYIFKAVEMCRSEHVAAMVTGPINKTLLHEAGCFFEGHTQLIAQLTGTDRYVMMLAGERLRVSLVTTHCSLRDVPSIICAETIISVIIITWKALVKYFAIENPRIAVAALNPHGGEGGMFGSEETEIIAPAVEECRKMGVPVSGPFPADTLFYRAYKGEFDAVIAMYHDQGLIPIKLIHFGDAVNVTLGLPIIRTSVDHGTAYDIAGMGVADPSSLISAIKMASQMASARQKDSYPAGELTRP